MHLTDETLAEATSRDAADIRARRKGRKSTEPVATLPSLSSASSDLVARILLPSVLDTVSEINSPQDNDIAPSPAITLTEPTIAAQIVRWQDNVQADESTSTPKRAVKAERISSTPGVESKTHFSGSPQKPSAMRSAPRAIARTMSLVEREQFMAHITSASTTPKPATCTSIPRPTLHVVSRLDVPSLRARAESIGYFARVILRDLGKEQVDYYDDEFLSAGAGEHEASDDAWLILGLNEQAVHELFESLAKMMDSDGSKKERAEGRGRGALLKSVAGGAVVGAVATYTGLAFA